MRCPECLKKHGPSEGLTHIFSCVVCGKKLVEHCKWELNSATGEMHTECGDTWPCSVSPGDMKFCFGCGKTIKFAGVGE